MLRARLFLPVVVVLGCSALAAAAQRNVEVPASCTPQVNEKLFELLKSGEEHAVDNVMVCGITVSASRRQYGGPQGNHEILPLRVTMPDGEVRLVKAVTNDDLDGVITAPVNASVFAYGQAFFPYRGKFAAGIHDVHCSTHRGADNGWVVVNGARRPVTCPR
jgi:hypothetical protein